MSSVLERLRLTPPWQTLEVQTARVYNWDVTQKRKEKEERGGVDAEADEGEAGANSREDGNKSSPNG